MAEPLQRLWTPEATLRLRDTSGKRHNQEERCIRCGAVFNPGLSNNQDSAMCDDCRGKGSITSNEAHPEVTDIARCKDPQGTVRCLLCAKPYQATGNVFSDQICSECRSTMKDCAKLVCAKCNVTICRLAPTVMDSGFVVRPNTVLHSNACNICKPDIKESSVVEIELYMKTQRAKKVISTPAKTK